MKDNFTLTWDDTKREATLQKRGIDFADMAAFDWDSSLTAQDDRRSYPETRNVSIGHLGEAIIVCVWCYRNKSTRNISLRKANDRERKRYEQTPD